MTLPPIETSSASAGGPGVRVLVLGAAGMLGRKLVARLTSDGELDGRRIDHLLLADAIEPVAMGVGVETRVADLTQPGVAADLVGGEPDVIFHLAAVVSGEAEADFEKGYRVNADGMKSLLEAVRTAGNRPRLVFSSSIAVFGPTLPRDDRR